MNARRAVAVATAALCVASGAAGCGTSTSGAPPLRICGTTVYRGPAGAVLTDAYARATTVAADTAGRHGHNYYVATSASCRAGSDVDLSAVGSWVVRVIKAEDGKTAAVVLGTVPSGRTLTFVTPDGRTHLVRFAN